MGVECRSRLRSTDAGRVVEFRALAEAQDPKGEIPVVEEGTPQVALILARKGKPAQAVPLRRVLTLIGSRPGCKLHIQHPKVSPLHLAILNDGSAVHAVDLVSGTGTLLNDLKLEQEELSDGDRLTIGDWTFRVAVDKPDSPHGTQIFTGQLDHTPDAIALEHISSKRIFKPNRAVCLLGRRKGCDITIADQAISRVHALVFAHLGRPTVVDLLTTTGTTINDRPVHYRNMRDGDVLGVGGTHFRVHYLGGALSVPEEDNGSAGKAAKPSDAVDPRQLPPDLIDIQDTESRQRWRIADALDKDRKRSSG